MSDGPSNSPERRPAADGRLRASADAITQQPNSGGAESHTTPTTATEETTPDPAQKKRDEFLYDLLRALDILVYVEFAAIYYLDISTLLLLLRTLLHFSQLTIPDDNTSTSLTAALRIRKPPLKTPNTPLLLLASILCFLVHLLSPPSSASELTRFYLHGSLIVDFIGQRAGDGWSARARLCMMDIVVAVVQQVACAVAVERMKASGAKDGLGGNAALAATPGRTVTGAADARRRIRGIARSLEARSTSQERTIASTEDGGIELDSLTPAGLRALGPSSPSTSPATTSSTGIMSSPPDTSEDTNDVPPASHSASVPLLTSNNHADTDADAHDPVHALEQLQAGQVMTVELHLVGMLRNHFWDQRNRLLQGRV